MTYLSKSSFSLLKSKSSISSSFKTLSSYISLTISIYLSFLSYQLWSLLCKKVISISNFSLKYSNALFKSIILEFRYDILLSFSLMVLFKVVTLKLSALLFSLSILICLSLFSNSSFALIKVLDKVCILSYSSLILSTCLIKLIKESLSSFDKI